MGRQKFSEEMENNDMNLLCCLYILSGHHVLRKPTLENRQTS